MNLIGRKPKKKTATAGVEASSKSALSDIFTQSRALFLIIATTVLVYANSLSGEFVFDDTKQIAGNPSLHSWGNLVRVHQRRLSFQRGSFTRDIPPPYYRPLFTAYLTVNFQLFGLWEPGGT